MKAPANKAVTIAVIIFLAIAATCYVWVSRSSGWPGEGFINSNGRIEATEIDIASKLPGRIDSILVSEGEFVKKGQVLAVMQSYDLEAQLAEAAAKAIQVESGIASAEALVSLKESNVEAAKAVLAQRKSDLMAVERRLARSETLTKRGAVTQQDLEDEESRRDIAKAAVDEAEAQVAVSLAAVETARADVAGAKAAFKAAKATVARIESDINECTLVAPRDGRIQYLISQPGEVVSAGGKIMNLVDLSDVYMTFFLPETVVGLIALNSDARIILDAAPSFVIPAKVTFVADTAQFTPKTVETKIERQKLMFKVKANIDRELLLKYLTMVKTGLPGEVWLKLDPAAQWPNELMDNVSK